jgi:hypothetical protein
VQVQDLVAVQLLPLARLQILRCEEMGDYHARRYEVRMTDEEETVLKNDLENLLDTFERDEIPPESWADVKLNDPILLSLAQHRSFRISRNHFFCPIHITDLTNSFPLLAVWQFISRHSMEHRKKKQRT